MKHDTRNSSKKLKPKDLKRITDPAGDRIWLANGQRFDALARVPNVKKPSSPKNLFTKKGYIHKHQPTYKPPKAELSPANWKRMMRERRKQNVLLRNQTRTKTT